MTANEVYKGMQKKWVEITGAKVGNTVKITRKHEANEQGFEAKPTTYSELKYKIVNITPEYIELDNCARVPYFILELIDDPKEVKLTNREVRKSNSSTIECGCCKLTTAESKKAITAFETLSTLFSKYQFLIMIEDEYISRDKMNELKALIG